MGRMDRNLSEMQASNLESWSAKIHKQTYLETCCVQVIDDLSLMLGQKSPDSLEFNQDLSVDQKVYPERAYLPALATKRNLKGHMTLHLNARVAQGYQQSVLIYALEKSRTKLSYDLKAHSDNLPCQVLVQPFLAILPIMFLETIRTTQHLPTLGSETRCDQKARSENHCNQDARLAFVPLIPPLRNHVTSGGRQNRFESSCD